MEEEVDWDERTTEMDRRNLTLKELGKRLVMSSVVLLDSLFNEEALQQKNIATYQEKLNEAALNQELVVLHLMTEKISVFETVVGTIVRNKGGAEQVVIRLHDNPQQLRIVPLKQIEKISILGKRKRPKIS